MPVITPGSSEPQYPAGTDGRMRISGANSAGVSETGTLVGSKSPVLSITMWKYTRKIPPRPSTVNAESPADASSGVVDATHLRRGGIRETNLQGKCLMRMNATQRVTDTFVPGNEHIIDLIFDKQSTLGHHGCVITLDSIDATGLNVAGDLEFTWSATLNGPFPAVSAG